MKAQVQGLYDCVVCGAGPAGLMTACDLSRAGVRVALLDRRDPWREPVACAEAVSQAGIRRMIPDLDEEWLRGPIHGVVFVSPDGTRLDYRQPDSGVLLNRALMHRGLAQRAAAQGADCHFRAHVKSLSFQNALWNVEVSLDGQPPVIVQGRCVVDATGAGGSLTRQQADLALVEQGRYDLEVGVFTLLEGIEHRSDMIEMFFGSRFFPGGYGWVFPRDGRTANVGLVLGKEFLPQKPPREMLRQWIAEQWPQASIGPVFGGPIACGQSDLEMGYQGLFKAGDSASQVNPISRSGILEALKGGRLVSAQIEKWLHASEQEKRRLEQNLKPQWWRLQGKVHRMLSRAKPAFAQISDQTFNHSAHRIARIPAEKRTLPRIFLSTLLSSPRLLWRMRSLMGL